MDETREYSNRYDDNCVHRKHSFLRHLVTALMTLLGAFLAFYVVTDWHYKRMLDPVVQIRKMDKMMQADANYIEKMASKQYEKEQRMLAKTDSFIRLEKDGNSYKVIVDLRPFGNDEKNVEVKTDGNLLTIEAAGAANKHGRERILKITQNYMFDDNVNLNNMTKVRQGKDLIIYIPTEK